MKFGHPTDRARVISHGRNVWDKEHYALEIDPISAGLHVMDGSHHQIHEGYSFTAYYTRTTDATDAHRTGLFILTPAADPNSNLVHVVASFAASAAASLSICEGVTIAANVGTHTSQILNRYRDQQAAKPSGCFNNATAPARGYYTTLTEAQIAGDGTWATGTVIRSEPLTVGVGPRPSGGSTRGENEYILKAGTKYVFLLTNVGANANTHWILLDWYEHRKMKH